MPNICYLDSTTDVVLAGPATIDTDAPSQDFEVVSTVDGVEVVRWVTWT